MINPSWGAILGPDAQMIAAYMLAATGAHAQVDEAEPVSRKLPCRDCNGGACTDGCATCDGSGVVVRMRPGHQVPDLISEVDEDVIVAAARALLASVGAPYLVVHHVDVVNNLIAQQEHGAERARSVAGSTRWTWTLSHLLAREEGRMGTAACGVHPFHPDQWHWDLVTAGRLDLCRRCHTSQQEDIMDHPFAEHYRAQDKALVDAQEALRSAMSDLERAQDVLTSAEITDEHWQGCCSHQIETEGVEVAMDVAERCLQGALRVLELRRERLSVLLGGEQ